LAVRRKASVNFVELQQTGEIAKRAAFEKNPLVGSVSN
jgi:hypothetical protein